MLGYLYEPPLNRMLAILLAGVALLALWLALQRFITAYRQADQADCPLWIIRGIRCLLIGLTAGTWSAGLFWKKGWLLIIGLVIIAQELYEGAVLSALLKRGAKIETQGKNFP